MFKPFFLTARKINLADTNKVSCNKIQVRTDLGRFGFVVYAHLHLINIHEEPARLLIVKNYFTMF